MDLEIDRIFLTSEFNPDSEADNTNMNTDVIVQLISGEKFIASFLSYQNIEKLRKENSSSDSFLNGKYYWSKNMLLIDECSKKSVKLVVNHLLDEGDFNLVFKKI